MADVIPIALAGVVVLQFVLAIVAYMDANQRELSSPVGYFYGISIPLVGFLILVAYLSERDELPTRDLSPPTAPETGEEAVWTIENRGLRRLPRRLAYTIQDGDILWRVAVAGPPLLLILTVLVHPRVAIALSGFCGLFWLTYLSTAGVFTNTTIQLDPTDGTLQVTWRGGDYALSPGGSDQEIDLADVQRAELRCVGTQPLLKLRYDDVLVSKLRTLPVSADQLAVLRETLSTHDVPVRDRIQEGTSRTVVRRRCAEGLFSLVVIPFSAGVVWPQFLFTKPVLLVVIGTILWLGVNCIAGILGGIKSLLRAFSS